MFVTFGLSHPAGFSLPRSSLYLSTQEIHGLLHRRYSHFFDTQPTNFSLRSELTILNSDFLFQMTYKFCICKKIHIFCVVKSLKRMVQCVLEVFVSFNQNILENWHFFVHIGGVQTKNYLIVG